MTAADVRAHLSLPSEEGRVVVKTKGHDAQEQKGEDASCPGSLLPSKGFVPFDSMQKAIARNMEATMSVPIFR